MLCYDGFISIDFLFVSTQQIVETLVTIVSPSTDRKPHQDGANCEAIITTRRGFNHFEHENPSTFSSFYFAVQPYLMYIDESDSIKMILNVKKKPITITMFSLS